MTNEPINVINGGGCLNIGLTKIQYFSAMAMQGILANSYANGVNQPLSEANAKEIAEIAVSQAIALIEVLKHEESR